jgi:hypothetical protein
MLSVQCGVISHSLLVLSRIRWPHYPVSAVWHSPLVCVLIWESYL